MTPKNEKSGKSLATVVGASARAARHATGMTQEEAAAKIGISAEFFARIERGQTLPSVPTLVGIAGALDVSADVLLGRDLRRNPSPSPGPERRLAQRMESLSPRQQRLLSALAAEMLSKAR